MSCSCIARFIVCACAKSSWTHAICTVHAVHAVQLVRPCKQLTYRLTGAVITDGLVLFAVDLDHWMKDLSYGVCPVIEDALLKARYGGRRHCREKRYAIDIAL